MCITELATNTITADSSIGIQSALRGTMDDLPVLSGQQPVAETRAW
jgi:hypothetical protein